ncbi:hypothetical protein [Clostridium perfringens]|uniref:hypothetical protein n=1 Tax=Clostridium perfringens TaxID=1502 RepID=UPI001C866F23|nr:hypothetical protein [Clostridium perfringens]
MERKEIIKDIQDECILFDGNCIGGINQEGCSKVDLCMKLFGNNFRPCEHDISELLNKADKEVLDKELASKEVKEELRECFEVLKNEKITVEYIKFLGKVCTYYGYTLNDLERKLVKNGKDKFRMGL